MLPLLSLSTMTFVSIQGSLPTFLFLYIFYFIWKKGLAFISQGIWAKKLNFFTVAIVQTKNHIWYCSPIKKIRELVLNAVEVDRSIHHKITWPCSHDLYMYNFLSDWIWSALVPQHELDCQDYLIFLLFVTVCTFSGVKLRCPYMLFYSSRKNDE
jgi:hypothetical protein